MSSQHKQRNDPQGSEVKDSGITQLEKIKGRFNNWLSNIRSAFMEDDTDKMFYEN